MSNTSDNDNDNKNDSATAALPLPDTANSIGTINNCSWTPNNIPLLVENAQGHQWTINWMNYVGSECVHYLSATTGEPRSKEDRFADRVFLVGCYENTSASRRDILNPLVQQATAESWFSSHCRKGISSRQPITAILLHSLSHSASRAKDGWEKRKIPKYYHKQTNQCSRTMFIYSLHLLG